MGQIKIKMEIRKCYKINEHENTIYQNMWDAVRIVFGRKCILLNAYIKKKIKV